MKSRDMETPGQPQSVSVYRTTMQHRAYQPLLPTVNRYLQQKWDKASYDLHRRKVMSAKPTINTTPPKTFGHLALKLKKQKLEEEWTMKTERENNMLMEKISHIMATTGGVDNRNDYDRKSLGKEKRQLELLRITKENQKILFRLSQCRPHYNVKKWNEDWLKTLKVMDSITHYPQQRAEQQKQGQEKNSQECRGCDKGQKISNDAITTSPASKKTADKFKSEEDKKRREATKKEARGSDIHDTDKQPLTEPDEPEKSSFPDASENLSISIDTHRNSVEKTIAPDGSDMSDTSKTQKQETTADE